MLQRAMLLSSRISDFKKWGKAGHKIHGKGHVSLTYEEATQVAKDRCHSRGKVHYNIIRLSTGIVL